MVSRIRSGNHVMNQKKLKYEKRLEKKFSNLESARPGLFSYKFECNDETKTTCCNINNVSEE